MPYELEFVKSMHCKTTKEMWDIFKKKYGGDGKVKRVKLQIYRMYFESLKMNEHGDVAKLFLRVDEIVYIP